MGEARVGVAQLTLCLGAFWVLLNLTAIAFLGTEFTFREVRAVVGQWRVRRSRRPGPFLYISNR